MTTSSRRAFVSIPATIAIALAPGACVRASSHTASDPISTDAGPLTIRFDNLGLERADVYLIGGRREWGLGRVEPGAIASLRIPEGAFADGSKFLRLAVIANEPVTF